MKKLFLLPLFLIAVTAHSQSNKTDTMPYHFSWKNGWAVKVAPLALLDAEVKVYFEKRIAKNKRIEFLTSYFIPGSSNYNSWFKILNEDGNSRSTFLHNYSCYYGYKIGFGYDFVNKHTPSFFLKILIFYKYYYWGDIYKEIPYEGDGNSYFFHTNRNFEQRLCVQSLYCYRLETKKFFIDLNLGIGARMFFTKSYKSEQWIDNNTIQSTNVPMQSNWKFGGVLPTPQFGVEIGFK